MQHKTPLQTLQEWYAQQPQLFKKSPRNHPGPDNYKNTSGNSFHSVKRIELTGKFGEKTAFDVRYFEVQPKGYTSYETHKHEHVIIGIRGSGTLIAGSRTLDLKVNDIAYIAPHQPHQIKNNTDRPFGFFCIVDHERDKPRVLD
ncbi:cupin domain-containing protein [Candidatus Thiosymbion oneisti]|uniref:cupin domain-containing protein n=1 Tax=Candidatus Thiosymbion oneisti TaxID=589554 RepID=UPI00159EFEAB|nr:cupin domain-containing protein [Candidatus Thiosymbion oneisti]